MSRLLLALTIGLSVATPAWADLPPPLPFTKYSTPTHRIETREDVQDYVFLVARRSYGYQERFAQPFEFVAPEGSGPATLTIRGDYRQVAELSVVPKAVAELYTTAQELGAAVESGRVLRIARHVFVFREAIPSWASAPIVTHELRRSSDDALVIVRTSRDPMWSWYAAAVPFTLALLFGGLWLVRRFTRRDRPGTNRLVMKLLATLFFVLCVALLARADIGPPAGKKTIPVTTVVEVTEDFPDYAFFAVTYSSSPGPPPSGGYSASPTLHFFVPGTTIKWTGDRRSGGSLYAIPRAEAEKNLYWKGHLKRFEEQNPRKHMPIGTSDEAWLERAQAVKKGEIPGAVSIRFGGSENVPTSDPRTSITETFRVVRTPSGVAFVNPDEPAAQPTDGRAEGGTSEPESSIPWKWVVVGAVGSFGLILGGVWLVMRFTRGA